MEAILEVCVVRPSLSNNFLGIDAKIDSHLQ